MLILITGGTGFVGAALAAHLLEAGHSVVTADTSGGWRLQALEGHPHLRVEQVDVCDNQALAPLVVEASLVFHLAAIVGVDEYIQRPVEVLDVNITGTRAVFQACIDHDTPVVFASTSEVYGKNTALLQEQGPSVIGDLTNRRWCYAISKAAGEAYATAMAATMGLRHVCTRYFNVYGPLMDRPGQGRVISKFIGAIQRGEPLTLVDGGHAVRSFCYIDDAAAATAALGLALAEGQDIGGRVYNIGRRDPITMADLAARIVALTGHEPGVQAVPGLTFFGPGFEEVPHRIPDVSALEAAVGFQANIDLDEGLRRTLAAWDLLA